MRIAVLGLGFMGSTHLKALRNIPSAQLAAVYTRDPAKLSGDLSAVRGNIGGLGERFDFSEVARYTSSEALLADASIEAIDICLPTNLHAQVAIQALQAGKHVLVEKPMALDAVECESILSAAIAHNRVLMTAQVLRFFPMYQILADELLSGRSGAIRSALFRRRCAAPDRESWLTDPEQSGGGVFDLLIHDADLCLHLFGIPETVSATGYAALECGMDVIEAGLHYRQGFTATITGGWHHPGAFPFSMEYTVVAEGGTFEYSSAGRPPALYRANGKAEVFPMPEVDGYASEIAYFVDCCVAGTQPTLCPPKASAQAVSLMARLLEARNRNGEKISCII